MTQVTVGKALSVGPPGDIPTFGDGPPLLFLHSGAAPDSHATDYLERLAQRFRVLAPCHPGFGRYARPAHICGVDDIAYHYLDLLDDLDLSDVTLVGASLGGWIASEITVRSTARIGRLVLVDPFGIKVGGREDREIADFFAVSPEDRAALEFTDPAFSVLSYAGKSDDQLEVLARGREAEAYFGWQPFMHNPQLVHWLHRIDVPTLLIRGGDDEIVVEANHDAFLARIPDCRKTVIPGAGHHPHLDAPGDFASAVFAFAPGRHPADAVS